MNGEVEHGEKMLVNGVLLSLHLPLVLENLFYSFIALAHDSKSILAIHTLNLKNCLLVKKDAASKSPIHTSRKIGPK